MYAFVVGFTADRPSGRGRDTAPSLARRRIRANLLLAATGPRVARERSCVCGNARVRAVRRCGEYAADGCEREENAHQDTHIIFLDWVIVRVGNRRAHAVPALSLVALDAASSPYQRADALVGVIGSILCDIVPIPTEPPERRLTSDTFRSAPTASEPRIYSLTFMDAAASNGIVVPTKPVVKLLLNAPYG
jgi:hypothetical protein